MEFFIYLKTLSFFFALSICGIIIIRRLTEERRAQILIPSGAILGVALYIFLINLVAHLIKGVPGFYISLAIEIFIAFLVRRYLTTRPVESPKGKLKLLNIISLLFWTIFLYTVTSTSMFAGDVINHYTLASLFSRGDYPMHSPWQPDYITSYHIGGAEFLGAARSITDAPYVFIHRILGIFMLLAWSQILTWYLIKKAPIQFFSLLVISTPAIMAIISLGGFMIAWPISLGPINFAGNIFQWLGQLPTIENASKDGFYGSPGNLDMMIGVLHRFLSISFFFCLVVILTSPKKQNHILLKSGIVILLSSIALVDETTIIVTLPAVFLISFFTIFNKSTLKTLLLTIIASLLISLQGGVITQTLLDTSSKSEILIFPKDGEKENQKYQTFRFSQDSSRLFENSPNYQPLRFFHPGIIWQLLLLLIISISSLIPKITNFTDLKEKEKFQSTLWLLFISSITALIAFHGIVPKYLHFNGNRFLTVSYFLSSLGIAFYLVYLWYGLNQKRWLILRLIIVWVLLFSFLPPFFHTFPRPRNSAQLLLPEEPISPSFIWVKDNLPIKERILVLNQPNPTIVANMALAIQVGALTPMWSLTPRVRENFETSPMYVDAYFTLNPDVLSTLKIKYLIISNIYLPQLAAQRRQDLVNSRYFQPVFTDLLNGEAIFRITTEYFLEGKNLNGTLAELEKIAPKKSTYYFDSVPNIPGRMFAALLMLLIDRDAYYKTGAWYDGRIGVELTIHNTLLDKYDHLLLAETTDPKTICNCEAKLLWTGLGNGIKLWKTN